MANTAYKAILLTKEETRDAMKCGLAYALENKDRWIDINIEDPYEHFSGYDSSRTYVVFNDIAYTMFKDYIFPVENIRLFILTDRDLATDRIPSDG